MGWCQNMDNAVVLFVGARFARPKTVRFVYLGWCQNVDNAVVSFVGARFARPKTVYFVYSGRQTLPLQLTK